MSAHQYVATISGMDARCAVVGCGLPYMAPEHVQNAADQYGADAIQCPGCNEIYMLEETTRMYEFRDIKSGPGGRLRVCLACAGHRIGNPFQALAKRFERGYITEDAYLEKLAALETSVGARRGVGAT